MRINVHSYVEAELHFIIFFSRDGSLHLNNQNVKHAIDVKFNFVTKLSDARIYGFRQRERGDFHIFAKLTKYIF